MRAVLTCFKSNRRSRLGWNARNCGGHANAGSRGCADRGPKPCWKLAAACRTPLGSLAGGAVPAAGHSQPEWLGSAHGWSPILLEDSSEIPETWLVFDWPQGQPEPYHIYTAWLDGPPQRISLLRLSRQRFQIEQYFQRDKDDLGLDHFEGRSWRGFHHHLALAATAYLFVLLVFLRAKKNFLPHVGRGAPKDPAILNSLARILPLL